MKEFLIYIVKSGIYAGVILLLYQVFFRKTTFFRFNRFFLLSGLITSLIVPAIIYRYEVLVNIPVNVPVSDNYVTGINVIENKFNPWILLFTLYLAGVAYILFKNLMLWRKLYKIKKNGISTKYRNFTVVQTTDIDSPFSVLNHVFINTGNLSETERDLILKHEITHISQKHWFDLLCGECMLMLQWFNPLLWMYVFIQKENHEYLADRSVINNGVEPAVYSAVLINQQFRGPVFSFSNSFKSSNHLNRLIMIKKRKSSQWKKVAILSVIPVFCMFLWVSAEPEYVFVNDSVDTKVIQDISIEFDEASDSLTFGTGKGKYVLVGSVKKTSPKEPAFFEIEPGSMVCVANVVIQDTSKNTKTKSGYFPSTLIMVDGKEISKKDFNNIEPKSIESVSILKDKNATELYGDKGKNGVVLITLKKEPNESIEGKDYSKALIVVDGKEISHDEYSTMDKDKIQSISILKDKNAVEVYGEKGSNGVIIIHTTKKEKDSQ